MSYTAPSRTPKWYNDTDEIVSFATFLDSESYFESTSHMLRFFEKPWKWNTEYECWKLLGCETLEEIEDKVCEKWVTSRQMRKG